MRVINCVCGHRLEVADDADVVASMMAHSDAAHPEMGFTEGQVRALMARHDGRVDAWDGVPRAIDAPVEILPLTPARSGDFLAFFDREAFADNPSWSRCYCLFYNIPHGPEWEQRTPEQNRADKERSIKSGDSRGLLAYLGGKVIGWCHGAPRSTLPGLSDFPEDADAATIGSIVCFNVAPSYRGQGLAKQLLAAACNGLRAEGMTIVEAYPPQDAPSAARAYHGTVPMYEAAGFVQHGARGPYVVMRKKL